mgnify:CR=1 FL=1
MNSKDKNERLSLALRKNLKKRKINNVSPFR